MEWIKEEGVGFMGEAEANLNAGVLVVGVEEEHKVEAWMGLAPGVNWRRTASGSGWSEERVFWEARKMSAMTRSSSAPGRSGSNSSVPSANYS